MIAVRAALDRPVHVALVGVKCRWIGPASQLHGEAPLLFDHDAAQAHFGASVFWLRRRAAWPNEQAAVEFWQVNRDGGRRGIVEVTRGEIS